MRLDTLTYQWKLQSQVTDFFSALLNEQLRYFQSKNDSIETIESGTRVHSYLQTKVNKQVVKSTIEIGTIIPNKKLELITQHAHGKILQTYQIHTTENGTNFVSYSETNELKQMKSQLSLLFTLPIYKLIYNKSTKKRMQYLEMIVQNN